MHHMNTLALSLFPKEHTAEVDAFLKELDAHPEWASPLLAYALHPKVVTKLLMLGGDVNQPMEGDSDGTTCLMNRMDFATGTPNEVTCWKILMSPPKKGVPRPNLLAADDRGQLPIHLIHDEAVFDVLVAPMGARKAEYVRSVDAEGNTALHLILPMMLAINATKVRDLERIKGELLQRELGALVEDAKAYAARQGVYAARFAEMAAQPAFPPSYVARLIREGADVGAKNVRGETPLHAAMRLWLAPLMVYGEVFSETGVAFLPFIGEVIRMLIAAGADVRAEAADGMRPIDLLLSAHQEAKAWGKRTPSGGSGQSDGVAAKHGGGGYEDLDDEFRLVLFAMIEDMVKELASCEVCLARQSTDGGKLLMCGGCERVWYCGTAHQKEHWGAHKAWCREHGLSRGSRGSRGKSKKGGRGTRKHSRRSD
jgi:hypothetical protein